MTYRFLTDLAAACRKSGLTVIEIPGWEKRGRPTSTGGFDPDGVLCHHTGSYDKIGDTTDDLSYAKWLAITGRSDLPAPLCQVALSAEGVVYVCAAGRANHGGDAKATGPMPRGDANELYVGIEAMNDGSQGWASRGRDAKGAAITQHDAYVRLVAALCDHYRWPASHVRAHRETSVTGKWDPGKIDMDDFRADVGAKIGPAEPPKPLGPVKQWRIDAAAAAGIENADAAAKACRRAGLPFWVACALLEKESGGRNIFGHDKGGAGPHGQPVTRANFEAFYREVLGGATSNGVGPCQITWAGTVKGGERDGGYFAQMLGMDLAPWKPLDNMTFGFALVRKHYNRLGDSWQKAGAAYNGRESYGVDFLAKVKQWNTRLKIKGGINPALDGTPKVVIS